MRKSLAVFVLGMAVGIFLNFAGSFRTFPVPVEFTGQQHPKVHLKCQEDEIIIGTGNFENGKWDRYQCRPLDDLIEGMDESLHDDVVREQCSRPRHWYRQHGVSVMPEGCETA